MIVVGDGMSVGGRALASALEVAAVGQAGVDVIVRESDRTEPLEVKVERVTIDLRSPETSAIHLS